MEPLFFWEREAEGKKNYHFEDEMALYAKFQIGRVRFYC